MKKLTSQEIRDVWLNYFKNNDHLEVESASLIPINDNSLLWINSGVATLKKYFSGKENPPHKNLTNSQKCIRTNDIFNVGVTSRHHTFFEMLGNFSIGGYFKEKAIELAFDLLINHFEIELEKLYFTVFEEDDITYKKWISLGINPNKILKCGRDRNFWDVGNGPCGPCTEIHYDRGVQYDPNNIGEKLFFEDIENDRYVEIWNIVFSEFNNDGKNNYSPLDRKNIDTGAGLERLACISQNVPTNFDTDLFLEPIKKIQELSNFKYDVDAYFKDDEKQQKINLAYKVIVDHARASVFAIADGAIPSNKERGYILRRLIRRLIVKQYKLGIEKNIFNVIVDAIIDVMKSYYPYLCELRNKIIDVLNKEFEIFKKTLDQGFKLYKDSISNNSLSGEIVFKLVETYGFPIELINELAQEDNLNIDQQKFEELFKQHQEISRSRQNEIAMNAQNGELLKLNTEFKFYYDTQCIENAKIVKLFDKDFNSVNTLNEDGYVVLDKSCCYATSGGQLHDIGFINDDIEIDNVIKGPNLQHIHHVKNGHGIKLNQIVKITNDDHRRQLLMKNHSVEHLIHATLTKLVDKNIKQEGAFKSPEKVTFDFQYHEKLSPEKLKEIENEINAIIKKAIDVEVLELSLDEAQSIGAKAYFEDVYKKIKGKLRVIKMGDVSCELCGGTHVHNTKDIELFKITNFSSKAAGSWRIEAITSFETINKYIENKVKQYQVDFKLMLDSGICEQSLIDQINNFNYNQDIDQMQVKYNDILEQFKKSKLEWEKQDAKQQVEEIKMVLNSNDNLVIGEIKNYDNKNVFNALSDLINEQQNKIFAVINFIDDKIQYMLATNAKNKINLNDTIKKINELTSGKGGGKPNFVQGGCSDKVNVADIINIIKEQLNA